MKQLVETIEHPVGFLLHVGQFREAGGETTFALIMEGVVRQKSAK